MSFVQMEFDNQSVYWATPGGIEYKTVSAVECRLSLCCCTRENRERTVTSQHRLEATPKDGEPVFTCNKMASITPAAMIARRQDVKTGSRELLTDSKPYDDGICIKWKPACIRTVMVIGHWSLVIGHWSLGTVFLALDTMYNYVVPLLIFTFAP
jgi:hypothetical protein